MRSRAITRPHLSTLLGVLSLSRSRAREPPNNDKVSKHGFFAYADAVPYSLKTFSRICHMAKHRCDDDIFDEIVTLEPASPLSIVR